MHGYSAHGKGIGRAGRSPCAAAAYLGRGVSCASVRRQCHGLYAFAAAQNHRPDPMGAGQVVAQGGRAPCAGRYRGSSPCHHGRSFARLGRALGDGGRFALPVPCGRCGRNLGRSPCIGFHRNQTPCHAGRDRRCRLLADPACGLSRFKCRARPLAHCQPTVCATSARSAGPGRCALGAGPVPLAAVQTRAMGGHI